MGHDIFGINKAGEEIAYARFNMSNHNATILYSLLDANDFHAGVSGSGESSMYSLEQIEKALNKFEQVYGHGNMQSESKFNDWDVKQISEFLLNCLTIATKEGSVKVYFG